MNKVFLDTNVWFYAFVPAQDNIKHQKAISLIGNQNLDICLSVQIVNELSVNLLKKTSFPENNLQLLIQSFYQNYQVFYLSEKVFLQASELRKNYRFSYWDSVVVASALLGNCDILYSEDMQHNLLVENKLTIQNPFI